MREFVASPEAARRRLFLGYGIGPSDNGQLVEKAGKHRGVKLPYHFRGKLVVTICYEGRGRFVIERA